jgi:hypothetical protein
VSPQLVSLKRTSEEVEVMGLRMLTFWKIQFHSFFFYSLEGFVLKSNNVSQAS